MAAEVRNSDARPGDVVAILGVGGLGHLGVQFAAKMGCKTGASARGEDKEPLARKLGTWHYIDSQVQEPATELVNLGGARVMLATVTSGEAMSAVLGGWASVGRWWSSALLSRSQCLHCCSFQDAAWS
jgi:D-arabinose 1-dehydrogenase-like Zn-dependent alcohol dehydrogenase